MKKPAALTKVASGLKSGEIFPELEVKVSTPKTTAANKVTFTNNPRHFRGLSALLSGDVSTRDLVSIAGQLNAPELIAALGRHGISISCYRVPKLDRDGRVTRPGIYRLEPSSRKAAKQWVARFRSNCGAGGAI